MSIFKHDLPPLTDAEKQQILADNERARDTLIRLIHDTYDVPVEWPFCEPLQTVQPRKVPRA